jgi:hypothetical protein
MFGSVIHEELCQTLSDRDDACAFVAGDANLRRYVGNDPTNAMDVNGLEPDLLDHLADQARKDQPALAAIGDQIGETIGRFVFDRNLGVLHATRPRVVVKTLPSGAGVQAIKGVEEFDGRGAFEVRWQFSLDRPAPADGYIVQKVTRTLEITPKDAGSVKTRTYWEAWFVKKNQVVDTGFARLKFTDSSGHAVPRPEGSSGKYTSEGEIKFFFRDGPGGTGDLGDPHSEPPRLADPATGWKNGNEDTDAKGLPSTAIEPTWWKNDASNKAAASYRKVTSIWPTKKGEGTLIEPAR